MCMPRPAFARASAHSLTLSFSFYAKHSYLYIHQNTHTHTHIILHVTSTFDVYLKYFYHSRALATFYCNTAAFLRVAHFPTPQ